MNYILILFMLIETFIIVDLLFEDKEKRKSWINHIAYKYGSIISLFIIAMDFLIVVYLIMQ